VDLVLWRREAASKDAALRAACLNNNSGIGNLFTTYSEKVKELSLALGADMRGWRLVRAPLLYSW
jgi:hypothetical protein